jgi:hypothetical protein
MGIMQFVKTCNNISKELLLEAFHRRVAFLCKTNEVGVGIVIPLVSCAGRNLKLSYANAFEASHSGSSSSVEQVEVEEDEVSAEDMTVLLCQVKNFQGSTTISDNDKVAELDTFAKGLNLRKGQPVISLVINVGSSCTNAHRSAGTTVSTKSNVTQIYIPVLDETCLPFLNGNEMTALRELVRRFPQDYVDNMTNSTGCAADRARNHYSQSMPLVSLITGKMEDRKA